MKTFLKFFIFSTCLIGASEFAFAGKILSQKVTISVTSAPAPIGSQDFQTRCAGTGVLKCVSFDNASDVAGGYGDNSGLFVGDDAKPVLDTAQKASGTSSLKFFIKSNSGSDSSGAYFTNFSKDLSVQFDGNSNFFIQWRQRFDQAMLNKFSAEGGGYTGFKQVIIGTGDKVGCTASTSAQGKCYSSCTSLETVVFNYWSNNFPAMYNSCSGSASHGPYDGFYQPFNGSDFKLQNAMPAPYCLYSQDKTSYFSPQGNCFGYAANEWMTFQIEIKTGPRVGDEFKDSYVRMWIAREGKPSQLVIDWGPYNLTAGSQADMEKFGKIWLTPYMTAKSAAQTHAPATTWYDELIISRNKIADPK